LTNNSNNVKKKRFQQLRKFFILLGKVFNRQSTKFGEWATLYLVLKGFLCLLGLSKKKKNAFFFNLSVLYSSIVINIIKPFHCIYNRDDTSKAYIYSDPSTECWDDLPLTVVSKKYNFWEDFFNLFPKKQKIPLYFYKHSNLTIFHTFCSFVIKIFTKVCFAS
jgi:hypothetical protein